MPDFRLHANLVLSSMPGSLQESIAADLRPRYLGQYETLEFDTDVVFPIDRVISLMKSASNGISVETAAVGYEGVFALSASEGLTAQVQVPGEALAMNRITYERQLDNRDFRTATYRYHEALLNFVMQTALCQAFHNLEERLAYWLLVVCERSRKDTVAFTQEYLAAILGVQRPSVSIAAGRLEDRQLIRSSRGKVTIQNVTGLEDAACPCYRTSAHVLKRVRF